MNGPHLTELQLNDYLDGFLTSQQELEFEEHFQQCPDCTRQLKNLRSVFADLLVLEELDPSNDLSIRVLAQLPAEIRIPQKWWWTFGLQGICGVVLALAILYNQFSKLEPLLDSLRPIFIRLTSFAPPTIPYSIYSLLPILISAGILWLVSSSFILRKPSR